MSASAAKVAFIVIAGLLKMVMSARRSQRRSDHDSTPQRRGRDSQRQILTATEAMAKPELGAVIVPGGRRHRGHPTPEQ